MKIAKDGLSWIITPLLFAIIFYITTIFVNGLMKYVSFFLTFLFLFISCILLIFFRDPDRKIGKGVVAVADGRIREIVEIKDSEVGNSIKISVFMNIQNVHVNRMPIDGEIKKITHHEGAHIPAFQKESEKNERVIFIIKTKIGIIKIVQTAGTIARRIVPYVKEGEKVKKGEKIGIIRLGSRVDVYLPSKGIKSINLKIKDKIKAGENIN